MTENNVMEFCQWLISEKGVDAGNLSEYINNNEEEVLKLAEEFKKPKFKIGGKIEAAAEMFKCGGKAKKMQDGDKMTRKEFKDKKSKLKDVRGEAKKNFGYNNEEFRVAYKNNKYAYKDKGMDRMSAKIAAQEALMNKNQESPIDKIGLNTRIADLPVDIALASKIANGPKKVFIETVTPEVINTNKKINTDIDFSKFDNLQFEPMPKIIDNNTYYGGQVPEVIVSAGRTNADDIKAFFKNVRFATPNVPLPKIDLSSAPSIPSYRSITHFMPWRMEDGGKVQKGQGGLIAKIKSYFNVNPDSSSYDGVMTAKDPIRPMAAEDYTPYARNLGDAFRFQHQTYRPDLRATEADTVFIFNDKKYDRRTPEDFAEQYYLSQYPDIAATMEEKMKAWEDYKKRTGAKYPPMGGFQKNEYK